MLFILISVHLSSIYLLVICGSFTLGKLFDFISAHFWLNGALYFSFENLLTIFFN